MPTALCVNCNKRVEWRNRRGARLADMRCPACGGLLESAVWSEEKQEYIPRGRLPRKRRGPRHTCPVCGRVGYLGARMKALQEESRFRVVYGRFIDEKEVVVTIPAREAVCWLHPVDGAGKVWLREAELPPAVMDAIEKVAGGGK